MGRLSFSDPDHWDEIHRLRTTPPPGREQLAEWIHAQYVPSAYEERIQKDFARLARQHTGTNERWLAISGPSHLGKSSVITHLLLHSSMTRRVPWRARTESGYLHTPVIYIEATSGQEVRGLLASIARFIGAPHTGTEKELHQMLCRVLPQVGAKLIVIDDAQMLRRVSDHASRLPDGLRHMLHLPTPQCFVGIDLNDSALLRDPGRNNDTVLQLQRRHTHRHLAPFRRDEAQSVRTLLDAYTQQMDPVPGLDLTPLANPRVLHQLTAATEGRPGSILDRLKAATIEALARNDGRVTPEVLTEELRDLTPALRVVPEPPRR